MKRAGLALVGLLALNTPEVPRYEPVTKKDLVEIITSWDVYKAPVAPIPVNETQVVMTWGTTYIDKRTMIINSLLTDEHRAITLLHEMYHVKLEKQGYRGKDLEAVCDDYAARAFKEIFGREYKMPANILDTVREEWKR